MSSLSAPSWTRAYDGDSVAVSARNWPRSSSGEPEDAGVGRDRQVVVADELQGLAGVVGRADGVDF